MAKYLVSIDSTEDPGERLPTAVRDEIVSVLGSDGAAVREAIGAGTASTKADVGLGNVNNTADANKPVSAAQAAADAAVAAAAALSVKSGQPWWDSVFAAPAADDTPTVTVATTGAITGGTAVTPTPDYNGDTHFRYDGCLDVSSPGAGLVAAVQPSAVGATYALVPEFVTSAGCDKVDIAVKTNSAGVTMGLRITVNGRWLTLPLQWFTTTANTVHYVRLTFPTAKARSIRIETVNTASFGGVVVPAGETCTRPALDVRKRLLILADSYGKGANANSTTDPATNGCSQFETFPNHVAKLLGCDSVINLAIGGTGWTTDGGGKSVFGARIADILAASPHIVLVAGSRNDSTATSSQVFAAARDALAQLADVPIVEVCGPEDDGTVSGTSLAVLNEAVKQAARVAGRRFNDVLGVVTAPDKNSADNVHPSVLGAQKLAKAFYASLDRPRIDEMVAAAVGGRSSTDLTLSVSPSSSANVGATVTLTATQSVQRAGKVAFYANNVLIGTQTVASGVATQTTSSLATGAYTFTARFLPSNPILVKSVTSNAVGYTISANLGFVDHFATDGPLTATENGKAYTAFGSITGAASGGVASITTTSGTAYLAPDAGTPNGTGSVKLGGTLTGVSIPLRLVNQTNLLRLQVVSSQIVLQQVVANASSVVATGTGGAWASGDTISWVLNGDTITIRKNGVDVPGLTAITTSQFNTATRHGIGGTASASGVTFDDLTFVAA
ncbi:hypothetical protein H7K45_27640 [Mycobacterium yunnanensis]|uniref:Lysophospholipase L1 n=1 Tax=Mycobacterium yunnanensis TaxID=368477 RepID=A0A9X3C4D4_9MYCO|nr:GDSL-type esterase/lipase family protein [Mycobacterium yunnanensis]MCV7424326.1 hypothetical protein [Mycobacterium yunnanensis]